MPPRRGTKKEQETSVADPTPDEAEVAAAEAKPEERPEVDPAEFTRGTDKPVGTSLALDEAVVEALRQPLDPNRIRTRKGRGRGQFEYLAGHDVKRRANEIFGFGNWGAEILECVEEALVQVENDAGTKGWHVAYRAHARVTVRGCIPISDVGYGDGVEYGAAAVATARELAMKEAATDAIKRALTQYGDQFGLILYAKTDEKQRIDRDRNVQGARAVETDPVPKSWPEINAWAEAYGEDFGWREWLVQATDALFGDTKAADRALLNREERSLLGQKAATVIYSLRKEHEPGAFPPITREPIQRAWAKVLDGAILTGPPWRMSVEEEHYPTFSEYQEALKREQDEAESLEFGANGTVAKDEPVTEEATARG